MTNARLSPVCLGLLKYRVIVKACPRLTVSSVLAYLSVWCVLAFSDGCQLICVGVRSVQQKKSHEEAASMDRSHLLINGVMRSLRAVILYWGKNNWKADAPLNWLSLVVNNRNFCLSFATGLSYIKDLYTSYTVLDAVLLLDLRKNLQGQISVILRSAPNGVSCSPSTFSIYIFLGSQKWLLGRLAFLLTSWCHLE